MMNNTEIKRCILIPGLGAESIVFKKIEIGECDLIKTEWLMHNKNETLGEYASRFIKEYKISKNDAIVGLSFGGILAQEIATQLQQSSVILLSSFRSVKDLRFYLRWGIISGLYKLMPSFRIPFIDLLFAKFLNSGTKESLPLLKDMLGRNDLSLTKWSLKKIATFNPNRYKYLRKVNIIGDSDRIMRPWKNENTHFVNGGSHFMVYDKAAEVNQILNKVILK